MYIDRREGVRTTGESDFKCEFVIKRFFADSDAKYVVMTQIFFPDAQSSKTTKLLAFKVFPDAAQTGPDAAYTGLDVALKL